MCSIVFELSQNSDFYNSIQYLGRRVIVISGSLIWSKILMVLIFNPCGEIR